jgi:hypothetical protein
MNEEFPEYRKFLDDMATDLTPVTLACLSHMVAAPFTSGQKRSRVIPEGGDGDNEDTRAFGSGGHHTSIAMGTAEPALLPPHGPTGQGENEIPPNLARKDAVMAFVASPLLPEPSQLRADHITALLALAVDGLVHKAAIKLLALAYSQLEAKAVWTAWAPHLSPPRDHPLARGTLLRDTIIQSLCTPYPTTKLARGAASKLVDDIAKVGLT